MREFTCSALTRQVLADDSEAARYGDLTSVLADSARCLLESMAVSEVEQRLGYRLYERGADRSDYRNGYRERTVQLPFAVLTIKVPRLRGQGYVPSFLERDRRAVRDVEEWVARGLVCGLSRAQVCAYMEQTCGLRPSDGLIKQVQSRLDLLAKSFKERPIADKFEYLFLDAAWVKDIVGDGAVRICILTAMGVTYSGEKQILGFERVKQESESTWRGFLQRLVGRGLDPWSLRLVVSDEHYGIIKAVPEVLGEVAHQLCWAHRMRNAVKVIAKSDFKPFVESLRRVYTACNKVEARTMWVIAKKRWGAIYPTLIATIEKDLRSLLAFLDSPQEHHKYIRTSNPIERVFLELRRRRYGCAAFADVKACDRALYGVYETINRKWKGRDIWFERRAKQATALS